MSKKQKIVLLGIVSVILVIVISISITVAFMKPIEEGGNLTEISLSSCAKIKLIDEASIDLSNTYPMTENKAMQTKPYKFTITSYCDSFVGFDVYLATLDTNTLDAKNIKYRLRGDNFIYGATPLVDDSSSDFSSTELNELNIGIKGTYKNIYKLVSFDLPLKGTSIIELYLYVDENATNETMNQIFKAGIVVKAHDRERKTLATECYEGSPLIECLWELQNWGPSETSIYFHDKELVNGANDNSLRYAGPSEEVNNFVCFGSDETPCPTDNLYRIIGVIDDKVKLIKYDYANSNLLGTDGDYYGSTTPASSYKGKLTSVNTYYWNYKASNNSSNTWSTSLLNKTNLNTNYINNIGESWANKIETTTWTVGGNTSANIIRVVPSVAYQNEITNPSAKNTTDNATTYDAKIGLMYVSDYGFAASPSAWGSKMDNYGQEDITSNNWMYMGAWEWTISRRSDYSHIVFYVSTSGGVFGNYADYLFAVRPSFNLTSSTSYVSGLGSMTDPIRIN